MRLPEKYIARLVGQASLQRVADSELLRRFLLDQDQAAFELLVHRFGPMVLGVCHRLLGQIADAEDAFQATFITLAYKARSIQRHQSLGSWLYKVAWRMCQRQRKRQTVLCSLDTEESTSSTPLQELESKEAGALLAWELNRLSESLRSVVVLCCLQGKSSKEAAAELGCPTNTVAVRLRRAREHLRKRLRQRGYLLSSGIAATLGITSASAQINLLAGLITQTAMQISVHGLRSSLLSAPVALLMKGALLTMWMKPVKLATLLLIGLGIIVIPSWNGKATLQAQPPELLRLSEVQTRRVYTTKAWAGMIDKTQNTYPHDENLPEEARKWIDEQKKQEDIIRQEAENRMKGSRVVLHGKLKQLQESYTKAGDLDRALAIRDQVRRLELTIAAAITYQSADQVISMRGQNGKSMVFSVRGSTSGIIWGDGIYSDDSDLGVVAVHAGLVKPGQTGLIKVTIMEGRDSYSASTRHGVTSSAYQSYPGSIRVERAELVSETK